MIDAMLGGISGGAGGLSSGGTSDTSSQHQSQTGAMINFGAKVGNSQGAGIDAKTALIVGAVLLGGAILLRR